MMNQVYKTLPDDRPITGICIVEDMDKCPKGYVAVSRTYDQDADADLWKDGSFFGRKCTRYLCLSKTEGMTDHVIESVTVINEKEVPPSGYTSLSKTSDSAQKAWRKKQLCFKYAHISNTSTAVTDIIVLSRMKKAPEEFSLSGEINGLTLCYKVGTTKSEYKVHNNQMPTPYSLNPGVQGNHVSPGSRFDHNYQNVIPTSPSNGPENGLQSLTDSRTSPLTPKRPAPKPPTTYATISGYTGLEGVPFVLNPKWNFTDEKYTSFLPKLKTKTEIDLEYNYEFRTERGT